MKLVFCFFFFLRIRPPPRSTQGVSSAASDVYKRQILEAIAHRDDHPTAAGIFALVSARHPGTSRATVYRTLEKLAALGIIRKVCHPGAVVRYDPRPERHHHLLCRLCGAMIDVEAPGIQVTALPAKPVQGLSLIHISEPTRPY